MESLPLLLSVPHGGGSLPRELAPRVALSPAELFYESDPLTRDVFAMGDFVQGRVEAEVSRTVVDMDYDPYDRPPDFMSGVVKYQTRAGKDVWLPGQEPSEDELERLIDRYHKPYHDVLERATNRGAVMFGIDCHSMAPVGLKGATDEGEKRPLFVVINRGNEKGAGDADELTASKKILKCMVKAITSEFKNHELTNDFDLWEANRDFSGGYILDRHGYGSTPWLQLQINQRLYLPDNDRTEIPESDREGIARIRNRLLKMLLRFCEYAVKEVS